MHILNLYQVVFHVNQENYVISIAITSPIQHKKNIKNIKKNKITNMMINHRYAS